MSQKWTAFSEEDVSLNFEENDLTLKSIKAEANTKIKLTSLLVPRRSVRASSRFKDFYRTNRKYTKKSSSSVDSKNSQIRRGRGRPRKQIDPNSENVKKSLERTAKNEGLRVPSKRRPHPLQRFKCPSENCDRMYTSKKGLWRHRRYECQVKPRFKCGYCPFIGQYRVSVVRHNKNRHKDKVALVIDTLETAKKEEKH